VKGHFGGEFNFEKMSGDNPPPKIKEENIEKFAREFSAEKT
jgi:hypothetical protein